MELGRVGIWCFQLELAPALIAQEAVTEVEALGYGAVWIPEAFGREALTHAGILLAGTERLVVATGIANIFARDPMAMAAAQKTLVEAYPDRFLLGMGVSHAPMVESVRGHRYEKPLTTMRRYLEAMDAAPFHAAAPGSELVRVLAALAPKMLALSAEKANGTHTYNVTPEHTARAREIVGPDALVIPEQAVILEKDADTAREIGRNFLRTYLGLPNYTNNLKRLGFTDEDFAEGGSNRLVDGLIAWGDEGAIRERVKAHHDAGADHVCVQVLTDQPTEIPREAWRELAPALLR